MLDQRTDMIDLDDIVLKNMRW